MIESIPVQEVVKVWPEAEPQLARVMGILGERTTHDVLVQLVTGNATLWRVGGAWCVTEVVAYPRKRVALASHMGGELGDAHIAHDALPVWKEWARAHGCTELRIAGRPGWKKVFPEFLPLMVLSCPVP